MQSEQINTIHVPYPEANNLELRISVGACRLNVRPATGDAWVAGSYRDPSNSLPIRVVQDGPKVTIDQGHNVTKLLGLLEGTPTLDLELGKGQPFRLTVETGASETHLELGGLPITSFTLTQGAGKMDIDFGAPNPQQMERFSISAGAVALTARNLANAHAAAMRLDGGAAAYSFDFGGALQHPMDVELSTGASAVEILVPSSTAAKIISKSFLVQTDTDQGFVRKGDSYWTAAATSGDAPLLTITAGLAIGTLKLRTTESVKIVTHQATQAGTV